MLTRCHHGKVSRLARLMVMTLVVENRGRMTRAKNSRGYNSVMAKNVRSEDQGGRPWRSRCVGDFMSLEERWVETHEGRRQPWSRDAVNEKLVETSDSESRRGENTMATLECGEMILAARCGSTSTTTRVSTRRAVQVRRAEAAVDSCND